MPKTKKRINRHREMVIKAMESYPECRNDDLKLLFQVLENEGVILSNETKEEIRYSGVEIKTLFRQRQFLQADGKFLPTRPEVLKKRRKLAADFADYYSELRGE